MVDDDGDDCDDADEGGMLESTLEWDDVSVALSRCKASIKMQLSKRAFACPLVVELSAVWSLLSSFVGGFVL